MRRGQNTVKQKSVDLDKLKLEAFRLWYEDKLTYREIAKRIGVSLPSANNYVHDVLRMNREDDRDRIKAEVLSDYRALMEEWRKTSGLNQDSAAVHLKTLEAMRKMLGLDEPAKTDITSDGKPITPVIVFEERKENNE